jgi:hypothetical protein
VRGLWFVVAGLSIGAGCQADARYLPRSGDIVFQTSRSAQSEAIQRATRSPYSHVGVVYVRQGQPLVLEAVEPVRLTPLEDWVARGSGKHFVAKRLVDADTVLTPEVKRRMLEIGQSFVGRHYDLRFEWSDERLYCSELVWKIYERGAGIELGRLERWRDLALDDPLVRRALLDRFEKRPPADGVVISPARMLSSELLTTVFEG